MTTPPFKLGDRVILGERAPAGFGGMTGEVLYARLEELDGYWVVAVRFDDDAIQPEQFYGHQLELLP